MNIIGTLDDKDKLALKHFLEKWTNLDEYGLGIERDEYVYIMPILFKIISDQNAIISELRKEEKCQTV